MGDIGLFALRFAFVASIAGIAAGVVGGLKSRRGATPSADALAWTQVAERAVAVVFACTSAAMLALFWALAVGDYQLAYVAKHSASTMPLGYRLAALWGGQSGSLLLWLWMLAAYAGVAVWNHRGRHRGLMPWVCAILLANALFFLVLTNFVTVPFEKLPPQQVLSDGNGLNPLLQHPAMMIHPLMLYTGFVGFAVPFAFALAALITGRARHDLVPRHAALRALFAWTFLGIGLACSAGAGPTRCSAGAATGRGTRSRTPR